MVVAHEEALAAAHAESAAQAGHAARAEGLLRELTATRRWRGMQAAFAPVDRLRRAVRRRSAPAPAASAPAAPAPAASAPPVAPAPSTAEPPTPGAGPQETPAVTSPARLPIPQPARAAQPPAPFVVGVPRSGTTLLRLQLDSHPQLAIGPETGWGFVAGLPAVDGHDPDTLLDAVIALDTWPDLRLDRDDARRALERARPWSAGAGLRELYRALAAGEGKARWGDKTPLHLGCMPVLAAALPEARFIHIIRDGRDVAASVRGLPFAPGDGSIEAIAADWRDRIAQARRDAAGLEHAREVHYERLVREPEPVLRELCDFLELPFDRAMLRAHERAADVMARLPATRRVDGRTTTRAERIARHAHLGHPPDPTRAGRWRETLTADEAARFESVAGGLLAELGYEPLASSAAAVP
jgi:hypothetical protein